jgi:hypothetical protein
MAYISFTNNEIFVLHFAGKSKKIFKRDLFLLRDTIIQKPNNIDIVSPLTDDQIKDSVLIYQLDKNNIPYINPLKNRNIVWKQPEKIKYVLEGLKQSNNEYCLILDGNDTVIVKDLANLIEIFNTYNKKIVFNASIETYPAMQIEKVTPKSKIGPFNNLNSGIVFGKTNDLIDFYEKVSDFYDSSNKDNPTEQYYIRNVYKDYTDEITIDNECKLFQVYFKNFVRKENDDFVFDDFPQSFTPYLEPFKKDK